MPERYGVGLDIKSSRRRDRGSRRTYRESMVFLYDGVCGAVGSHQFHKRSPDDCFLNKARSGTRSSRYTPRLTPVALLNTGLPLVECDRNTTVLVLNYRGEERAEKMDFRGVVYELTEDGEGRLIAAKVANPKINMPLPKPPHPRYHAVLQLYEFGDGVFNWIDGTMKPEAFVDWFARQWVLTLDPVRAKVDAWRAEKRARRERPRASRTTSPFSL